MSADPDEDALAWAGDDDPTLATSSKVAPPEELTAVATGPAARQTPGALLITYGVLGGIYLIFTFGWLLSVQRFMAIRSVSPDPLTEIMFQFGAVLTLASPALWFGGVFILTRGQKPLSRLAWLLVGLITVLPWPFILGAWSQ